MEQKIALVAGASRGLGLLVARELGLRGHQLVICARDGGELDIAAQQLRGTGCDVHPWVCDVGDNAAVIDMVNSIEKELGPIDVLFTVAGIIQVGPLAELDHGHFEQAVSTMLWGPINLALAVLEPMRRRGHGHIATVTSVGGMVSVPHLLPYSTAKFGAVGFSQGLRSELSGSGVKVTTIVPGLMRTGSHLKALFTGQQGAEYSWFSLGASTPVVSMDAKRAARRMVQGVLAGRGMVVLTPLAKIGIRVHGVAPALTAALLGRVGRLLPGPATGKAATLEGAQARLHLGSAGRRANDLLTVLGRRAATRLNQTRA